MLRSHATYLFLLLIALFSSWNMPTAVTAAEPADPASTFAQGVAYFQQGSFEQAAMSWMDAARQFEQKGQVNEQIDALIHLSEAFQSLGHYTKAATTLDVALGLSAGPDRVRERVIILGQLAHTVFALGQSDDALKQIDEALTLARTEGQAFGMASLFNEQGRMLISQKRLPEAITSFSEAVRLARETDKLLLLVTATVNAATAHLRDGNPKKAQDLLNQAFEESRSLHASHDKAYVLISIGVASNDLRSHLPLRHEALLRRAAESFQAADAIASRLNDQRARSYALGHLGHLYELSNRTADALILTRQALHAAQQVNAPESLYRWEWQIGRLLKTEGKIEDARLAYRRAVATLQPIRHEFIAASSREQGSFRESVGPLFFELTDVLLHLSASQQNPDERDALLVQARNTVEEFKSAELQDYFRDDCVQETRAHITPLETVSKATAVVYPIILPDRLELLVGFASGLKRFSVPVSAEQLTKEIRTFRHLLEKRTTHQYLHPARQLYDWIIRPLERDLKTNGVHTLVFVPDGPLRTIPMAPLHDGTNFLIAKYALATTPGLTLTDPRPMNRENLSLLSVGLSESVQGFPSLPNVEDELGNIQKLFGGQVLMNDQFLVASMERQMQEEPITIVHIASHGEFNSDVENSFLLAFDEKLTMDKLDRMIGLFQFRESPLDLLTLSACQTAAGDDRAALGLAGVAVKAGARSALATLWFINDVASSTLVSEFYTQLQDPTLTKAVALQRAQLDVMQDPTYTHPGYWSPFLLINNWL